MTNQRRRAADQSSVGRIVMQHPRLNWGTVAAIGTVLGMLGGLVVWVFGFLATEKELKDHVTHDNAVQSWNKYSFAANRLEYLEDKQAECTNKRLVNKSLAPDDEATCKRYDNKYSSKQAEVAELKGKADETTKEKP